MPSMESGNRKIQCGRQVVILKVTSLNINKLPFIATNDMYMRFETEIPKQTQVTLRKPCRLWSPETEKSNVAARRPV